MGKLPDQSAPEIQHFSHPHPLQLSNYQPQQTLCLALCSGCKLHVSGWIYGCTQCNYFLHLSCSQTPQQITHPFHPNHVLFLLSAPIYPGGLFNCDACGKQGDGFSYHCGACNIDIHTTCAAMPLLLTHQSHHHHPLNLTFSVPYLNRNFSCDICHNFGSNQWLYRCNICEFDAHLDCATAEPKQAQVQVQHYYQAAAPSGIPQYHHVVGTPLATGPAMLSNNYATPNVFGPTMTRTVGRSGGQGNASLNQMGQILAGVLGFGFGGLGGRRNGNSAGIDLGSIFGGGNGGGDMMSSLSGIDIGGSVGGIDLGGAAGGLNFS